MVDQDSGGAKVIAWSDLRPTIYPLGLKAMDIEIDFDRIRREEAWWWLSKIMNAYYALQKLQGNLDSELL